ncbi:MAG TPA: VCBS repeat-containing protein, partial [Puia sp.]|nr:VCBS repeat-containing protein [Puia sp.]
QSYAKNMPLYELVKNMPSTKISNYIFRNKGDLTFSNETENWGLDEKGVSSGAAYVDLDNDGDMDLIVCHNNDPVSVYENHADKLQSNNYIKIKLTGEGKNRFGIGAKVIVVTDSSSQMQEMYPVRGYQSSVDYLLNFGLGHQQKIREIRVLWPADHGLSDAANSSDFPGLVSIIPNPAVNKTLTVAKKDASRMPLTPAAAFPVSLPPPLFTDITKTSGLEFRHRENTYVDFKREFLIPYELSRQGPKMAKGDVNKDGLEDVFIGGASGQGGRLWLQVADGKFMPAPSQPWQADSIAEDIGALFFDADNDGDLDLYVVSGGNEWDKPGPSLQDRLYLNDGKGHFTKAEHVLPTEAFSGSCVTAADFDHDGDLDLFIGARCIPGYYPFSAGNMVLRNDFDKTTGKLHFTDVTKAMGGDPLFRTGMVTDAVWSDIDKDGWPDLLIVGDWMPISIFHNDHGRSFTNITAAAGLGKSDGFWCKIVPADVDKDGNMDFIVGNLGTNTQFRTTEQQPLVTYAGDFNNDGRVWPLMTWYTQNISYPFNSRDELTQQMPILKKKFLRYSAYGTATIGDILSPEQIAKASKYYVYNTRTSLLINKGGKFELRALPMETQFSMMSAILYKDYDGDGKEDIFLAGNFFPFRVQQGQCDAGLGTLLRGDGKGGFTTVDRQMTGLCISGDVRDMVELKGSTGSTIIISKNDAAVQVIRKN